MNAASKSNRFITLILIIVLIPFLSIFGIKNAMGTSVYQIWQIISVMFHLFLVCKVASEIKINWAVGLFVLYQSVVLLSCFINQGFSSGILIVTVASICLFMLLQSSFYYEILSAICVIVGVSVIINLPIMIPNLSDMDAQFFIGGKNALGMFLIPGAFLLLIYSLEISKKVGWKHIILIILCLVSVFLGTSGTGMVVAFFAVLLMILTIKFRFKKWTYILVIVVFYALLVLFSDVFFATSYWSIFTEILGKDTTLTSRVTIWSIAKDIISENWLFGSGRGTEISYINTWGKSQRIYEAHNFILEIMMEGGIVALTIYSVLFYKTVQWLNINNMRNKIIFVALCVLLINGLTESTVNNFFVTIILGMACRHAIENRGKKNIE